ncbi:glycosyltransferase family 4 protein [Mucilaginibacter pineti]|nr:glycosyltransferase family 4 protein [Mucilaginibacter pineti]
MKIAIIVNPLIPVPPEHYGGIERIIFMLIQELVIMGHNVTLYAHQDSVPGCPLVPYREHAQYSTGDFLRINFLTAKIAFAGFDLVHTFGRMSNIALLMFSGIKKIVSYQLPPTVLRVKNAAGLARNGTLQFTACSNFIAGQIKDFCKVTTIYNGVDIRDYDFQETVQPDAPLVFLGRIQKEKGTAIAIKLALQTGNKLVIAGNVPMEAIHQQYFEEEVKPFIDGITIRYIGPVNNAEKNVLLGNAKAFLMPVMWDEPFGIVMAEALACGTPVIGFNRGALPEIIENGKNGFLCRDYEEMCQAVQNAGAIDRHQCRETARIKFSAEVIARHYEELYKQMTGK